MTKPLPNRLLPKAPAAALLLAAALLCGCTAFSDTPEAPTGDRVCTPDKGCGTTIAEVGGKLALGASPLAFTSREHLVYTLVPDSNSTTGNTLLLRSFDTLSESAAATIPLENFALDGFRTDQRLQIALSRDVLLSQSPKGILLSLLDDSGTPSPLSLPPQANITSQLKVSPSGLLIPGFKANGAGDLDTYNPSLLWLAEIPGQDRHFFSISCFTKSSDPQAQTQCATSILAYSPTAALTDFECLTLSNAAFFCEKIASANFPNLTVNPSEDLLSSGRTSAEAFFFLRSGNFTDFLSFFDSDIISRPEAKESIQNLGVDLTTTNSIATQRVSSDSPAHYVSLNNSQATIWLFTQNNNRISGGEHWLDLDLSSLKPRALAILDPDTLLILGEHNAFGMRLPGQKGAEQEMTKLLSSDWSGFAGRFSTSGPYIHILTGTELRTLRLQSSTSE